MSLPIFITGTNTDVGKTTVACSLIRALSEEGYSVLGIKPLATGCDKKPEGLRNSDALLLQSVSTIKVDYATINPFAFLPAIAPHIAATQNNVRLCINKMRAVCKPALGLPIDILLIEGAGGWMVPLNENETYADWVQSMKWPVILVVGMTLGCINHALLTVEAIQKAGVPLWGWVANFIDPDFKAPHENFLTLLSRLPSPCLAVMPFGECLPQKFNMIKIKSILSESVSL